MAKTKQVIVMRKDLQMRKGKMIAQGAHASLAFLTRNYRPNIAPEILFAFLSEAEETWIKESFVKVCVGVGSLAELMEINDAASAAGLPVHLITDAGLTEFHGVPTKTCLAVGPDWADKIDAVTGHLKLL